VNFLAYLRVDLVIVQARKRQAFGTGRNARAGIQEYEYDRCKPQRCKQFPHATNLKKRGAICKRI
jgi:hypothetical protein